MMIKMLKITTIFLWIILACSPRVSNVSKSNNECGDLRHDAIIAPIVPVNWYKNELQEFNSNNDLAYQFIHIVSPTDDNPGFLLWLRVKSSDSQTAELVIANSSNKKNTILKDSDLMSMLEKVENGGFYQFCNDEPGTHTSYLSALKKNSAITFQFQGINSDPSKIKSDKMTNVRTLYDALLR